ncbi:MAG: hypothetical protein AVDCRST_MAG67-735, partial [uncultured Solirubrobacteraceae bacterium]
EALRPQRRGRSTAAGERAHARPAAHPGSERRDPRAQRPRHGRDARLPDREEHARPPAGGPAAPHAARMLRGGGRRRTDGRPARLSRAIRGVRDVRGGTGARRRAARHARRAPRRRRIRHGRDPGRRRRARRRAGARGADGRAGRRRRRAVAAARRRRRAALRAARPACPGVEPAGGREPLRAATDVDVRLLPAQSAGVLRGRGHVGL